jgi:hypothetical protein
VYISAQVYSPGKDHSLFLWITLKPYAHTREVVRSVLKLQEWVDQIVDPETRDEDNEILAGVGFSCSFYKKVSLDSK